MSRATLAAFLVLIVCGAARAVPDFRRGMMAGPLRVYPDDGNGRRFYYPPGDIEFAVDAEGRPDFRFLLIAYSGTSVSGDRGVVLHRNLISIGVRLEGPSSEDLRAARTSLRSGADLRPLPIHDLRAGLVYATAREPEGLELPPGHFEGEATKRSYWTERTYNLRLDNETAQLFWQAMHEAKGVISIAYAFVSEGARPDEPIETLVGSPKLVEAVKKQLGEPDGEPEGEESGVAPVIVKAGATNLTLDAERWPDLFRKEEFSGNVPPGYPLLDVRCYDFSDETRPDLHRRRLEIDAEGVGGSRVRLDTTFGRRDPDLYARALRFPFAVRLDRPYRYRVIDTTVEGDTVTSEWREAESWSRMLDITSKVSSLADYLESKESKDEDGDDETN